MTDKQLRHLSKADLIDIIYQMKQTEEELRDELAQTQEKLDKRELKIGEAGSIAEAVVGLSGVFEAAQAAADEYLAQIRTANADTERRCAEMVAQAQARCDAADEEIRQKWAAFEQDVQRYLQAHDELKNFLGR